MAEIIKVYKEEIPDMRFIGKPYHDYSHWGEWFANGWFDTVEAAMGGVKAITDIWKDGGGYIGLERRHDSEPFEYWLGMFTPAGTEVPDGFSYIDFKAKKMGVCWIRGSEQQTHSLTPACAQKLIDNGIEIAPDENGAVWSFENCTCPRYTTPDENGEVVLDYCYFVR